ELRGEARRIVLRRRPLQAVECPAAVVADQDLALRIRAAPRDLEGRGRQFPLPRELPLLVLRAPDPPGRPVAVDVGSAKLGEGVAPVDDAAREGAEFRMRVLDDRPWCLQS